MNDAHHRLALPQGTRIQGFEFHRVLGQGGFGITYLGWNMALDIPVAIKEYLPSDLATREYDLSVVPQSSQAASNFEWGLDRFIDEARILARFHHPNIVRVHHFFEAHSTAYIVMEYAEGETLSAFLEHKRPLREAELKAILYPILDGLEVVHRADFLHRDIKPGNIIIRGEDNSPVLLDFGSARQAIGTRSRSVTSIITPGYAPIEQYSSRGDQGPWTDIYALGGVCYRALTGEVPDDATERVRHDPLIPVVERCVGQASAGFLSAIDWALEVDEGDRPQSIATWRTALERGEKTTSIPPEEEDQERDDDPPVHPVRKAGGIGRWLVQIACIVAFLIGGIYYTDYVYLPGQRQAQEVAEAERQRQVAEAERQHPGRKFRDCAECPEMVVVPRGSFMMGSPSSEAGRDDDEGPQHRVTIGYRFAVSVYEVTFAEWDACVAGSGCNGYRPSDWGWGRGNRPVMNVSWNDAQSYVRWLSARTGEKYRLLSESEWEYVARADTTTPFHFGKTISTDQANHRGVYQWKTLRVGSFSSNSFGLYDVHGNVWEWTWDCWNDNYRGAPSDGSAWESGNCDRRVLRGGSWINDPSYRRSANRNSDTTENRDLYNGFRVARRF